MSLSSGKNQTAEVRLEPLGLPHCGIIRPARVNIVLMPWREFDITEYNSFTNLVIKRMGCGPMDRR
jgi:hypothetical protein